MKKLLFLLFDLIFHAGLIDRFASQEQPVFFAEAHRFFERDASCAEAASQLNSE